MASALARLASPGALSKTEMPAWTARSRLLARDDGTLVRLDWERATNALSLTALPVRATLGAWGASLLAATSDLRRLIVQHDMRTRAIEAATGAVLRELPLHRPWALTPDGSLAIEMHRTHAVHHDLDQPTRPPQRTMTWHQNDPGSLYLDSVDAVGCAPAPPRDDGTPTFHLIACCYSEVIMHRGTVAGGRVAGQTHRAMGRIPYDPTRLFAPLVRGRAYVQSSVSVHVVALATGGCADGPFRHDYNHVSACVPDATRPSAWCRTGDGDFLWEGDQRRAVDAGLVWLLDGGLAVASDERGDLIVRPV